MGRDSYRKCLASSLLVILATADFSWVRRTAAAEREGTETAGLKKRKEKSRTHLNNETIDEFHYSTRVKRTKPLISLIQWRNVVRWKPEVSSLLAQRRAVSLRRQDTSRRGRKIWEAVSEPFQWEIPKSCSTYQSHKAGCHWTSTHSAAAVALERIFSQSSPRIKGRE